MDLYLDHVVAGLSGMIQPIQQLAQHPNQANLYALMHYSTNVPISTGPGDDPNMYCVYGGVAILGGVAVLLGLISAIGTYVQSRKKHEPMGSSDPPSSYEVSPKTLDQGRSKRFHYEQRTSGRE